MRKLLGKMTIPGQLEILKDEVDKTYVLFEGKVKERVSLQRKEEEAGGDSNSQPQSSQDDSSKAAGQFKKWDEDLKTLVWNILCLEWELAKLDNELQYVVFIYHGREKDTEIPTHCEKDTLPNRNLNLMRWESGAPCIQR